MARILFFDDIPKTHKQYLAGGEGYLRLIATEWGDVLERLEEMPGYLGEPRFNYIISPWGLEPTEILNWSMLSVPGENIFAANYFTLARLSLKFSRSVFCPHACYPNKETGYMCGLPGHEYEECVLQKIGLLKEACVIWLELEQIINEANRFLNVGIAKSVEADMAVLLNKHLSRLERIKF